MGSTKPPSRLTMNSRSSQIRSSPRLGTNTMVGGAKRSALEIIADIIDLKMRPNVHELAFELQTYLRQIGYDADDTAALCDDFTFGPPEEAQAIRDEVKSFDGYSRR